ncbi:MAG: ABC transporter permease subunit [Synergistaceae bacterium]|jgi:NitT/TauT family transport system permease protein|nr:ABC transporter permease subunit [Synergistaceae bacterium]
MKTFDALSVNGSNGRVKNALLWLACFILLWEASAAFLDVVMNDPFAAKKLPYFHSVIASFPEYGVNLLRQAAITLSRAAFGFLFGATFGITLALFMSMSGLLERMLLPYLLASQMIPILGLAPIVFSLVKDIDVSRVVISAYITFFPVSVSFLSGLHSVGEEERALMRSLSASGWDSYRLLFIPFALPYLFNGLKIAAPMAVTAAVFVDTLSTRDGIGSVIILTLYGGGTVGQFWPAVLIASILGIGSFVLVSALEYKLIPWRRTGEDAS